MNKLSRAAFIKQSLQAGAFVSLATLGSWQATAHPSKKRFDGTITLMHRLVAANDAQVAQLLQRDESSLKFSRKLGHDFATACASCCSPGSKYYHSAEVVATLQKLMTFLAGFQAADGTVNIGNIESPPDTAFLLETLTAGAFILKKDGSKELDNINGSLKDFLLKAGEALVTGGVHTPNHRWVVCAALARLNALYPNRKYLARMEDWLGEGIFNDADGHYPERSITYSNVENNTMATLARLLNKPALLVPVRRNLELVYYCSEPNGDVVTNDSRRQDQYMQQNIMLFYLHYRYLAIKDSSAKFAGIAAFIESLPSFEDRIVNNTLYQFLENDVLQKELPAATPPLVNFEKLFTTSHLLRIRRNDTTATLFGGADLPITIASGRSNSPNFFAYRKGKAVLDYMRLSTSFFSTGYFYSDGLQKTGNSYVLSRKLEVPYYQPLPKHLRNAAGDYKLSPSVDDRFWNKMDFKNRPVSNVKTLQTTVSLQEKEGRCQLQFYVTGQPGVDVTIELHFSKNGNLSGATDAGNDNYFLENGTATYTNNGDTITIEGGSMKHKRITDPEGERYTTHFGSLRTEGLHLYLTGITPFNHQLVLS